MADQGSNHSANAHDDISRMSNPPDDVSVPMVEAQEIFALTPALYSNRILDYGTASGQKIFNKSIEKLSESLFDIEPEGIHSFLNSLEDRAMNYGWEAILEIPKDINNAFANLISLIRNYGEITIQQVQAHVTTYITRLCRPAQDSQAFYLCLINTLSTKGKDKVNLYRPDFTVNGRPSGALLLKVIIRECRIDTRATIRHIRSKLSALPSYLASTNYNIPEFNRYVLGLLEQLRARGAITHDLLANLFIAYESATDKDFVYFIKQRKQAYDMGADLDESTLMQFAQIQYQIQIEDGTWSKPSADQERLVALETKLKAYESGSKTNTYGSPNKSNNKHNKNGRNNNKGNSNNNKKSPIPEWKKKPPSSGKENKPVKRDGKTYYWCHHHQLWCIHKPKDCRGATSSNSNGNASNHTARTNSNTTVTHPSTNTSAPSSLRLSSALTSIQEDDE